MKYFGSKMMNSKLLGVKGGDVRKFGVKAMGILGDLAPIAAVVAPPAAPALEALKLASIGIGAYKQGKKLLKK